MPARVTLRPAATTAVALFASVLLAGTAIIIPRASFAQKATTDKPDQNAPKQDSGQGKTDSGKADAGKAGNQPQAQQAGFQKWFSQEDWVNMVRAFRKMRQAKVDLETTRNFGGTPTEIHKAEQHYEYLKADFETEARIYLRSQEQSVYDAGSKLGQARTAADKAKKDKAGDDVQDQAKREVKEASDALDKAIQPFMPQLLQQLDQFVEERRKQKEAAKNTKVEQPTLPPNEVFTPQTPSKGPTPNNTKTGEGTGGSPQSTPMLTTPQDTPKKNPGDSSTPNGAPTDTAVANVVRRISRARLNITGRRLSGAPSGALP